MLDKKADLKKVSRCVLTVSNKVWRYAETHEQAIADHWKKQKLANPAYFNGPDWLMFEWALKGQNVFHASFLRTEFRAYLFWRARGFDEAGVWDAFGSGVVVSRDGGILLGEQNPGNVNAGYSYPPSGFIDDADVSADGVQLDIEASITREIYEETGLGEQDLTRQPGALVTVSGAQVSLASVFHSPLSSDALKSRVSQGLAQQENPELARVHMVHSEHDISCLKVPRYGQTLVSSVLQGAKN